MKNNEQTQYNETPRNNSDEQTIIDNDSHPRSSEKLKKHKGARHAAGLAGAAAAGAGATILSGFTTKATAAGQENMAAENDQEFNGEIPAWSDGEVAVAQGDYDDMSFSEAFAAARAEVGPGGAFEWHGRVYGTYLRDEWQNMSAEERADYKSHFSWNSHSSASHDGLAQNESETSSNHSEDITGEVVEQNNEIPVVEVIGVAHNSESDSNIAVVSVDDDVVVLVDVDNDERFDVMATDINSDGKLSENEVFDIRDNNLTVADLGGFTETPELEPVAVMYGCPTDDFHEMVEPTPSDIDTDSFMS